VRRRVGERADDPQHLDDRAGPAVRDDERQRVLVLRTNVNEVNVQPVDLADELRELVEPRLEAPEVRTRRPKSGRSARTVPSWTPCD
jgi:hypothetical protein